MITNDKAVSTKPTPRRRSAVALSPILSKNRPDLFGPDMSYDGYRLKNGKWVYVENLDMRNMPDSHDDELVDPKKQAAIDKAAATATKNN